MRSLNWEKPPILAGKGCCIGRTVHVWICNVSAKSKLWA